MGAAIREAMAAALKEADIVFVTGGLGPTTDDITREAAAELLGLTLQQDVKVAEAIKLRLRTRGFPMTDRILRQADVPEGAEVLPNANGTAPGLYLKRASARRDRHLFLLPGPPRELRADVSPLGPADSGGGRTRVPWHRRCARFGIACVGESVVEAAVGAQLLALPGS